MLTTIIPKLFSITAVLLFGKKSIMPVTINGFGTAYFGKRYADEKGTYLTTLFIAAFHIPVFPLATYWVMPYGTPVLNAAFSEQKYEAIMTRINWQQVLSVYLKWYAGLAVALFSILFIVGIFVDYRDQSEGKHIRHGPFRTEVSQKIVSYLLSLR